MTLSGNGQVQLEPACAESVQRYGVSGLPNSRFVWDFDHNYGEIIDGAGTDTITIRWGYKTGMVEIQVTEYTDQDCFNYPSEALIEIRAPFVDLGYDFPEICEGDSLILSSGYNSSDNVRIEWQDGNTTDFQYVARRTEQIWVKITDEYECYRYDTVSLLVHELPVINLGNDTILCDRSSPMLLDPGDFASYTWYLSSSEDEDPEITSYLYVGPTSMESDTIRLTAVDYNDCIVSDTIIILPCDFETLFRDMPNTITPDGDGENDVWNIPYMDFFDKAVLEIFDRWGRLVYRTTNVLEEPWDGTSGGRELPMDAYYFVLNLNFSNAEPLAGTVNLIR